MVKICVLHIIMFQLVLEIYFEHAKYSERERFKFKYIFLTSSLYVQRLIEEKFNFIKWHSAKAAQMRSSILL